MDPSNPNDKRPSKPTDSNDDHNNPFITFRRFADDQISSLVNSVLGLPSALSRDGKAAEEQRLPLEKQRCPVTGTSAEEARARDDGRIVARERWWVREEEEVPLEKQKCPVTGTSAEDVRAREKNQTWWMRGEEIPLESQQCPVTGTSAEDARERNTHSQRPWYQQEELPLEKQKCPVVGRSAEEAAESRREDVPLEKQLCPVTGTSADEAWQRDARKQSEYEPKVWHWSWNWQFPPPNDQAAGYGTNVSKEEEAEARKQLAGFEKEFEEMEKQFAKGWRAMDEHFSNFFGGPPGKANREDEDRSKDDHRDRWRELKRFNQGFRVGEDDQWEERDDERLHGLWDRLWERLNRSPDDAEKDSGAARFPPWHHQREAPSERVEEPLGLQSRFPPRSQPPRQPGWVIPVIDVTGAETDRRKLAQYLRSSPYSPLHLEWTMPHHSHYAVGKQMPDWRVAFADLVHAQTGRPFGPEPEALDRGFDAMHDQYTQHQYAPGDNRHAKIDERNGTGRQHYVTAVAPTGARPATQLQDNDSRGPDTELDMYDRFLGSSQERSNTVQPSSGHIPTASSSTQTEPISQPSVLSTLTTTERTVQPDGTTMTKVILKKRFADGKEESSETVHVTQGQGSTDESPHLPSSTPSAGGVSQEQRGSKKRGWFWSG
ncbi:hypothetical protein W97_02291 [Coniosporium apollinis CBS 100218]|uniref:Uncharacterized protein n=1 Tax=Coniosporium apollinis (strain CBS 100218) TaxID=1168221 RepID=R7YMM5_CONA1|nr:uncharacterized protein W97_02291 [Coniosporium apollinis CBS 100218]EON63064.1 hypothetical protein W97_02291 [Coniosporium apollinis CBS 100218]